MTFFENARTRLVGFFRNVGAGSPRVLSKPDPPLLSLAKPVRLQGKHRSMMANG